MPSLSTIPPASSGPATRPIHGAAAPRGTGARAIVGPLAVGAAVWCAAGLITVADSEHAATRLAMPAAWWIFPIAVAVAALVPAWRRRPLTALPALLSTLPWWPVPWPAVMLIWTGPLAWLPILVAIVGAVGSRPLQAIGRVSPRRSTVLAGVATLVAGALVAWSVNTYVPGGDEPHYLVIAQSLLHDHDLRIENNHRQRDYAAYFDGEIAPDFLTRGRDGEIYSIHAPGLPALVLPAFALLGYRGVEAFLLLLAAVTGALVWRIGWRATGDMPAAWFAWAAVAGSATFLLHSFTVYPDGPGALIVAVAILLVLRLRLASDTGVGALVAMSVLLAALPWLHTRFVVLAAGLGLVSVWRILVDATRPTDARRRRAALFLAVPCASAIAWFGFFQWIYGTPNPAAPYGHGSASSAAYVPGGLLGLLFDEQFGLLMYAPVLIFVVAGLIEERRLGIRAAARATTAVAATYLAAVSTYWLWWAGSPASPARFAVAVLPACAMPVASAWTSASADRRRMMLAVLGVSLAISGIAATHHGDLAWNMRNAEALWLRWLGPVVNLPRAWPSFFWRLDPARLMSEWAFVLHVAVWLAIFGGGWIALWQLGRDRHWSAGVWRAGLACWLCAGIMGAAQAGWWLTGVSGLDPTPSQVAMLSASGAAVEIAPGSVRRIGTIDGRLAIVSAEPGRLDAAPPWLVLESVPAGDYELQVTTKRPRAGDLVVYARGASTPIRRLHLNPLSQQAVGLALAVGAAGLVVAPDADLEKIGGRIELRPVRIGDRTLFSHAAKSYGANTVYFLDDHVFAESDGFWVKGASVARLAIERQGSAVSTLTLAIQNGQSENPVVLTINGAERRETFGSFQTKTIELAPDAAGVTRLSIASPAGFRPADDGVSRDTHFLGVRVKIQ